MSQDPALLASSSLRPLRDCAFDPFASLAAAIAYFPEDRWSAPTIAAAMSFALHDAAILSPVAWASILDRTEQALASVFSDLASTGERARAAAH